MGSEMCIRDSRQQLFEAGLGLLRGRGARSLAQHGVLGWDQACVDGEEGEQALAVA